MQARANSRPAFDQQMSNGNNALQKRQYANAVQAFTQALNLFPNDPQAQLGLQQANAGLNQGDYQNHMAAGQAALQGKRYRDAVREFEAALLDVPGDPAASNGLRQASALLGIKK